ncbi:MAG TPA: histidine triad nucleotide-binding protein [Verrucomicrobiae bacterium]|jgi:histidine triad (HIT) family protein|nr:histidine triad nucleotide-binding protein [Verrucomicrobiae bacterium]
MSDCLFCKIVKGEIPSRVAYQDERVFAFHDINPQAPVHVLVIPKKHIPRIAEMGEGDAALMGEVLESARKIASQNKWKDYRLVINDGPEAAQTVFHVHLHLLSGRRMTWPPG